MQQSFFAICSIQIWLSFFTSPFSLFSSDSVGGQPISFFILLNLLFVFLSRIKKITIERHFKVLYKYFKYIRIKKKKPKLFKP